MGIFKQFKKNQDILEAIKLGRKKKSWKSVARKYKKPPYFKIENYGKYSEVHFYPKSARIDYKQVFKMPLLISDIVYLSRHFPDDVDFFEEELIKAFKLIRRNER